MARGQFVRTIAQLVVMSAALVGSSAACVANEPAAPTRGTVVSGPPPAPIVEARPATPPPSPTAVWVSGYWHWTGAQYTWVPGHWETPPAGDRWTGPQYSSRDGAYFYEAGHWEHGTTVLQPATPANLSQPARPNPNANALR